MNRKIESQKGASCGLSHSEVGSIARSSSPVSSDMSLLRDTHMQPDKRRKEVGGGWDITHTSDKRWKVEVAVEQQTWKLLKD